MTGQHSPFPTRFLWEPLCVGTGLKTDPARQQERIKISEETLVARSLELKDNAEHEEEFQAVEGALRSLAVLKRKRLAASRTEYAAASRVYCNSAACQASGNNLPGIIVRYERGPPHLHFVRCPCCAKEFEVELNAKKIWFVQREG